MVVADPVVLGADEGRDQGPGRGAPGGVRVLARGRQVLQQPGVVAPFLPDVVAQIGPQRSGRAVAVQGGGLHQRYGGPDDLVHRRQVRRVAALQPGPAPQRRGRPLQGGPGQAQDVAEADAVVRPGRHGDRPSTGGVRVSTSPAYGGHP